MEVTSKRGRTESLKDMLCEVENCSAGQLVAKYKCPKCFLKYCSLNCWKDHSKVECKNDMKSSVAMEIDTTGYLNSILFPTDDIIRPEDLEKLKYDVKIKELLRNPALRQIVEEVDKAQNVRTTMQQAMLEPIFVEFADQCLSLVNPDEDYANDS